ncbi:MAG: hypothetical protein U0L09_05180 [Christensenellales bacterium]|nr:hypothetical protein [Christensenellales bacterium]
MGGYLLLAGFLCCGLVASDGLFRRKSGLIRLWLGLCSGLLLMMWLPTVFAFFLRFSIAAQLLGLASAGMIAAGSQYAFRKVPRVGGPFCGELPLWLLLTLIVPMAFLSGCLQHTHILHNVNGTLHSGQSTYGDLCLHLGIATSLQNAAYPPDYSILKGVLLGYPFLSDSMVTSMLLFGTELAQGFVVTGTLMMTLVALGYIIFVWELTRRPLPVVLAYVLLFVNGGLGFLYVLDGVARDPSAFLQVFTGFYKTPTNMPDLNLRWVNVICDMMIPQRTLLGGWTLLIPTFYLLVTGVRENSRKTFGILGIWAGAIPMVHTHSFLGLGLLTAGMLPVAVLRAGKGKRRSMLLHFALYGGLTLALALPQLAVWTFPQTMGGGSLALRFNWVNNQGNGRLIDGYFWFWIKNVGLIYLFMVPAVLSCKRGTLGRMLGAGALTIYLVAELIQFQPNEYDNNKLFYVAFMAMLPMVGSYLTLLWDRLKGIRGRALLAACFLLISTLSGALSIGREIVSDYQLFTADEVAAAEFIRENTDKDAMFLTGQQHTNAVAALTGRYILCGTGSYLYYHGVDYSQEYNAMVRMLENPSENEALFSLYQIDYVYLSSHELGAYQVDQRYFEEHFESVFSNSSVKIYAVNSFPGS